MNKLVLRHKRGITATHTCFHCVYWGFVAVTHPPGAMTLIASVLCVLTICVHVINDTFKETDQ